MNENTATATLKAENESAGPEMPKNERSAAIDEEM